VPPFAASGSNGLSTVDTTGEYFPGNSKYTAGVYGLGQRVPMLVVSPWSKGGWVCSETFDHTSIIRFIEKRFERTHDVTSPNISDWRRAVCGDLTSAFNFKHPNDAVPALPSTAAYVPKDKLRHNSYVPLPPLVQAVPKQEAGVRPARALPYELFVRGRHDEAAGKFQLDLINTGDVGAAFLVYTAGSTEAPRTYTVEADNRLSDKLPVGAGGAYDFTVHGPNGFLRRFVGKLTLSGLLHPHGRALEVKEGYDVANGNLELRLINHGRGHTTFTVKSAYTGESVQREARGGDDATVYLDLRGQHAWYDLTVTASTDAGFHRRLAGHVETERASASDPALGV
jgi:phospholipase C